MIKVLARSMAKILVDQTDGREHDIEVYDYGLQIILGSAIKFAAIFFLSILMKIHYHVLVLILSYLPLRQLGGGAHLSTYNRCLGVGIAVFLSLGKTSTYKLNAIELMVLMIAAALLLIHSIAKYIPAGTEKKAITSPALRLMQKRRASLFLIIWSVIIAMLINYGHLRYVLSSISGVLAAVFFISPLGYRVLKIIDYMLDRLLNSNG